MQVSKITAAGEAEVTNVADVRARIEAAMPTIRWAHTAEEDRWWVANILLPQDYRDQTILALGTSYVLNPEWTLRAGARFASQALRRRAFSSGASTRGLAPTIRMASAFSMPSRPVLNSQPSRGP